MNTPKLKWLLALPYYHKDLTTTIAMLDKDKNVDNVIKLLIQKLMNHKQKVELAIYAAELANSKNKASLKAIEAAKKWLANPNEANRKACVNAADAADSTDAAAYAADDAAYAVANSAYVAADAAYWSIQANKNNKPLIIAKAIEIIERDR